MAFDHPKFAKLDAGVPLKERHERFCGHYVETRDPVRAFRMAFAVDVHALPAEVFRQAKALLADPEHRDRIAELREVALLQIGMGVRDLLQDWVDIASADPNDIVAHRRGACRHCWGLNHAYQWKSADEYTDALELAQLLQANPPKGQRPPKLPTCDGGFDYNPTRDVHPTCPACYGQGEPYIQVADTTKLQGPARKLYAGVSKGEVVMHDQHKARESLARVWGAFKDLLPAANPVAPGAKDVPITPETAKSAYLEMVNAGKQPLQVIQGGKR